MGVTGKFEVCPVALFKMQNIYIFSVTLAFIVRKPNGKDTEASETINVLRERNIEEELGKHKMFKITLQGSYLKFRKYTSKIMFCLKV
jgi:hypothetical protein